MTRDQAIAELEELRVELEEMGFEGKAYYPIAPDLPVELRAPWSYGRRIAVMWREGVWRVELGQQYPSGVWLSAGAIECDTFAKCKAWLAWRA